MSIKLPPLAVSTSGTPVRMLLLDLEQGGEAGTILAGLEHDVIHARFAALDAAFLQEIAPACIVFPLFSRGHDAIQVIERLDELVYSQAMIVLARALPRPAMVESELRSLGPGSRLTLIVLGPAG